MRVIIPYPRTSVGGVETLTCSVIRELIGLVDKVVWVLPENLVYLKESVPQSERLIIESFKWTKGSWQALIDDISRRLLVTPGHRSHAGLIKSLMVLKDHQSPKLTQLLVTLRLQLRLQYLIKRHRITHGFFPWTMHVPVPCLQVPTVGVVYDLNWQRFPENFHFTTPDCLDNDVREWVSAASAIVTPSHSVQGQVEELCPEFKSKVRTVHAASALIGKNKSPSAAGSSAGDSVPIFYYPGAALDHKGHLSLFKAALRLADTGRNFKLVLTGPLTAFLTGHEPSPHPLVEKCRTFYLENGQVLHKHIEALDFCEQDKVEELYSRSRRVVLPSQYEGFGLPLIEAIARGCRVICSDIEPYQEQIELYQCADFVKVVPIDDAQALASSMEEALLAEDDQRLSQPDVESIVSRWTWNDAARAIVSILQETNMSSAD